MKFLALFISLHMLVACGLFEKSTVNQVDCRSIHDTITNQDVYVFVEDMPEYPGGMQKVLRFFTENFEYPQQDVFQGSFQVGFIVDTMGNVVNARIKGKDMAELTLVEKEILRVIENMPKWSPGKCKGEVVSVLIYMPIKL